MKPKSKIKIKKWNIKYKIKESILKIGNNKE